MNSAEIPFQLIDDDEFEALEVAIAAAECSSTSSKKYKLSENPSYISYTAPFCENLTTTGLTCASGAFSSEIPSPHKPACSTKRAAENGQPFHHSLHAASYSALPSLQSSAEVLHCWESSNRAADIGQSRHNSLHAATYDLHCPHEATYDLHSPDILRRVAEHGQSSHDSLCVAAKNVACSPLQSSAKVFHKHIKSGLSSTLADENHAARFLGSATGAGDEAYQAEYRENTLIDSIDADTSKARCSSNAELLSEAEKCTTFAPRKMYEKPCLTRRLPSWQTNVIICRDERLRPSGDARIEATLVDDEAQPASSSDFPEDLCIDNSRRPWGLAPSTCRMLPKWKVPYLQFKGRIKYSVTILDAENAAHELLRQVEAKKGAVGNSVPLGFDAEWKAIFKRGAPRRKVAVLQLCIDSDNCHVFHVIHTGIPSPLRTILEDPLVFKVGVGAYGDAAKLRTDYDIKVIGVKDLSNMANVKLDSNRNWSLSSLTEELLGKQLDKNGRIRTGDWEVDELCEAQLQYAATDAFASLYLFQVLMTFPDPQKEEAAPNIGEIHSDSCMHSST